MALGAAIIQSEFQYADTEVVNQIRENPYLQYFVGIPSYKDEKPFDASSMVHFRKRLSSEILIEINELILKSQRMEQMIPKLTIMTIVMTMMHRDLRMKGRSF